MLAGNNYLMAGKSLPWIYAAGITFATPQIDTGAA
jgi:hypothetical protein